MGLLKREIEKGRQDGGVILEAKTVHRFVYKPVEDSG
jgi:hypothetical protein